MGVPSSEKTLQDSVPGILLPHGPALGHLEPLSPVPLGCLVAGEGRGRDSRARVQSLMSCDLEFGAEEAGLENTRLHGK